MTRAADFLIQKKRRSIRDHAGHSKPRRESSRRHEMKIPIKKSVRKNRASARLPQKAREASSESEELSALLKNMFHPQIDRAAIHKNVRLCARLRKVLGA